MSPQRFYISGPMRGIEKFNFPAFDRAAAEGRKRGYAILSPADMDRELGHNEDDLLEAVNTPENQRRFAARDTSALLALRSEDGDGIALLPGWEKSTGALAEVMLARWLGLRVVSATTWEPIPQDYLNRLDLSPVLQNLRRYLGDESHKAYIEGWAGVNPPSVTESRR